MILYLTSSPTGDLDGRFKVDGIDYRNGFCEDLRSHWKEHSRVLMITATPDDRGSNEEFAGFLYHALQISHLSCDCVDILDRNWMGITKEEIHGYDMLVLGGGHVPTQNRFFAELGLREKLIGYAGIVMGISAGTMNCADVVYAQPEEPGEAVDPGYQRWLRGLGLTDINVLPHLQMLFGSYIDGKKLFEEVTYPDSQGHNFIALPDGSYVSVIDGQVSIHGEAYRVTPDGLVGIF